MYDIDLNRYTEVVDSAIALRPQIEKAVDEICAQGYSNLFFIGCGGTYAHSLPMMYWLESTTNKVEAHAVIAAEFMVMGHKAFSKDSVCIFSTRSGNTKEIVAAAKFCKEAGARTMVYVSNDNTPVCEYADYKFYSPGEDPDLSQRLLLHHLPARQIHEERRRVRQVRRVYGAVCRSDKVPDRGQGKVRPVLPGACKEVQERRLSHGHRRRHALGRGI